MNWLSNLEPLLPRRPGPASVALVGAGGKTTTLFALAREGRARGDRVLVTTTTALRDPRSERDRPFDFFLLDEELARPRGEIGTRRSFSPSSITILATGLGAGGKISGPRPERCGELKTQVDLLLVEADGSRGLPIKAPNREEPVLPEALDLVIACLGLDALGQPATESRVHRLDLFLSLTGLTRGEPIGPEAIACLLGSEVGLFAKAPRGCRRVLCLTKMDLVRPALLEGLLRHLEIAAPELDLVVATVQEEVALVAGPWKSGGGRP